MIHLQDLPYLREIDIDFQNHIGGYMGGGSWAITSTMDSNGDNARIIIRKNSLVSVFSIYQFYLERFLIVCSVCLLQDYFS